MSRRRNAASGREGRTGGDAGRTREARIVVTGIGAVSPWGWDGAALWAGLAGGRTAVAPARRLDVSGQRTRVAGEVPEPPPGLPASIPGWSRLTAADRFSVCAAQEAVCQARVDAAGPGTGVFFAGSTAGMAEGERWLACRRQGRRASIRPLASHALNNPGDAVARSLGVQGRVLTISSACSSAALAIAAGFDALRRGEVDVAVTGAADSLCLLTYAGFNSLRAVDPRPCRPFRRDREGLSLGEGAGVLVLEREESARRRGARPLATLLAYGASCDAHHMTAPHPEGTGAASALSTALARAGVAVERVSHYNAHGTGTPLNDLSEWKGLAAVLGRRAGEIPVSAVKESVGHLLGASGAIEAVATVLALTHRAAPPTADDGAVDPETPVDLVRRQPRELPDDAVALSASFAFGGANAVLVLGACLADRLRRAPS
ncbi:MAG: beta-ketoacyl-[acyl-carrier-protein] synthase family protein [Thermoanaerobaculia bacterium]